MGTSGVIGRYRPSGCLPFYSYQKQMSELSETSVVYPGQNLFAQSRRRTGVSIEPICFGTI